MFPAARILFITSVLRRTYTSPAHVDPSIARRQVPRRAPHPSSSGLTGQVESVEINVAPGLALQGHARQVVGAVLDLLQGKVTVQKMSRRFWDRDVVFEDGIRKAVGLREVEAQWWALKAQMRDIEMQRHEVTSVSADAVELALENRYTLRTPLGIEKLLRSTVVIEMDLGSGKITRVADKWNGTLPDGKMIEYIRRANSYATSKLVTVPSEC